MEDGVPGTEEGTAQPVEEEEATQDEDILTFEEFKQRRMMEVQLHQQEELKNSGKSDLYGSERSHDVSIKCYDIVALQLYLSCPVLLRGCH